MRRLGLVLVCLGALVAAGFAGAVISGHTGGTATPTTTVTLVPPSTTATTVPHASVKVLVANGTTQSGAAAHVTQALQAQGWATAPPTNTTSPAPSTGIYFGPGQQPAAAIIAAELGAAPAAVQPLSPSIPVATTTGMDVVVVIGPDLPAQAAATTAPAGGLTPVT